MAHLSFARYRAGKADPAWAGVAANIGTLINHWSGRHDIIACVGPLAAVPPGMDASVAPAALFYPGLAEMEINSTRAFGAATTPADLAGLGHGEAAARKLFYEFPAATGAIIHEAMHARHTKHFDEALEGEHADYARLPQIVKKVIENLEETRIEARGVKRWPADRVFLRACALKLVMGDLNLEELAAQSKLGMLQIMLLTLARVDAGVLDESDVAAIHELLERELGYELLVACRELWVRAQATGNVGGLSLLQPIAEELVELVKGTMTEKELHRPTVVILMDGGGEPGGEPAGDREPIPEDAVIIDLRTRMEAALSEDAEETEVAAADEAWRQAHAEDMAEEAEARSVKAREDAGFERAGARVFAKGTGPSSADRTRSRLVTSRPPTAAERAAAVTVARQLEKARYRDRDTRKVTSKLPPGRLKTRTAVQSVADRRRGALMSAEPWQARRHTRVEDPKLTVGVMVDISGSMGSAMQPMATTAWMLSEATKRVQGTAAMVYFGNSVFPTLQPGQYLPEVKVYSAPDGTEEFMTAATALEGVCPLVRGTGARLLVIASDMCYRPDVTTRSLEWVRRACQAGVGVLIMSFDDCNDEAAYRAAGATVLTGTMDPAEAALVIGAAASEALTRAGRRT